MQTVLLPPDVESPREHTLPGGTLIGLLSGGPRAPFPPKLSFAEHFIAIADAHRPTTSWLRGTFVLAIPRSHAWWTAT